MTNDRRWLGKATFLPTAHHPTETRRERLLSVSRSRQVGALSFVHVFLRWRGPLEDLPFGEIEGVNLSDPSLLTEMYGWTVLQMVDRYVRLGTVCLLALLALYIWGLVSAYLELRRSPAA